MAQEHRTYVAIIATCALLVLGVFLFPPLTTSSEPIAEGITQAEFEESVTQELAHCESQISNVDCECFASMSGYIQSQKAARVPFAVYADGQELARGQASSSC
ncbi:hypothetical protein [uncultured Tateyamaria sp.]|uniref:hypothetical protein n=1 Tax=uncultured Tateyamaria sp. TaxID=455651 RepID=UPI0026215747|nr:hypothetical protein [uncultured Tateyamaria sp.]